MGSDDEGNEPATKRRKTQGGRRKAACQTCSLRKVKCDNLRPECSACQSTKSACVYITEPDENLTLNRVVEILGGQISSLQEKLDTLTNATLGGLENHEPLPSRLSLPTRGSIENNLHLPLNHLESSRDFSHIPPHKTTADEVLTWPIFENAFPSNYLIDPHLGYRLSTGGIFEDSCNVEDAILSINGNVAPLDEHRIPVLVDKFLENVHTKNPILDVEELVRKSREATTTGIGWNGYSCLLLLACSLGLVARPFGSEAEALEDHISVDYARHLAAPAKEKEQADYCFVQASRRIGGLRPSILAAQCNFFAGVYLMYTLRPMLSWQYFHQASIIYQLYLKMSGRISDDNSVLMHKPLQDPSISSRTTHLEQRLYWSCFKSEAEFRVELPLPQSEIASYEFPDLFPSPPSPLVTDVGLNQVTSPGSQRSMHSGLSIPQILTAREEDDIKLHAKRLCNEEESWYYYLTEVALRRIGNRIINTCFTQDRTQWLQPESLINVAIEFEAQVSTWKTNLPPAMQKYETNSTIRAPRITSPGGAESGFVSQELSWATENRLLEMRHWLYQPFLYYLVHARPALPSPSLVRHGSFLDPATASLDNNTDMQSIFWNLIDRAIDCNLSILETRTIPHRHHGLWFDLRAIICSSFLFIAVVKSGYEHLIPGGLSTLIGDTRTGRDNATASPRSAVKAPSKIGGKLGRVLKQLEIWSHESPDMVRAKDVLQSLIQQVLLA